MFTKSFLLSLKWNQNEMSTKVVPGIMSVFCTMPTSFFIWRGLHLFVSGSVYIYILQSTKTERGPENANSTMCSAGVSTLSMKAMQTCPLWKIECGCVRIFTTTTSSTPCWPSSLSPLGRGGQGMVHWKCQNCFNFDSDGQGMDHLKCQNYDDLEMAKVWCTESIRIVLTLRVMARVWITWSFKIMITWKVKVWFTESVRIVLTLRVVARAWITWSVRIIVT